MIDKANVSKWTQSTISISISHMVHKFIYFWLNGYKRLLLDVWPVVLEWYLVGRFCLRWLLLLGLFCIMCLYWVIMLLCPITMRWGNGWLFLVEYLCLWPLIKIIQPQTIRKYNRNRNQPKMEQQKTLKQNDIDIDINLSLIPVITMH